MLLAFISSHIVKKVSAQLCVYLPLAEVMPYSCFLFLSKVKFIFNFIHQFVLSLQIPRTNNVFFFFFFSLEHPLFKMSVHAPVFFT